MEKTYKYRIYPNKKQRELFAKTFGSVRFVYNYYLAIRESHYKNNGRIFSRYECSADLTKLKKELDWLNVPDRKALESAIKDLDDAYKNYFKGRGHPRFKSKKAGRNTYRTSFSHNNIEWLGRVIKLPKIGKVKIRGDLVPNGRIINATISMEPSGKYYCFICCADVKTECMQKTGLGVGIDLGIKYFATMSDGSKIENQKYLSKSLKKLAVLQRELSRKTRGSKRYDKAKRRVAIVNERIKNQRKDFLHKLSTQIVKRYDVICLEDLRINEMVQNNILAKDISDVAWGEFVRFLDYKSAWYGKKIVKINRWYKSSQTCSHCGHVFKKTKDLSIREWTCPKCKTHHDRDVNAAKNILKEGLRIA